jgi:hypothetical protein
MQALLPVRLLALALLLVVPACGGDDDGDGDTGDGIPVDAALGADASERLPDAGEVTACGDGESVMYCERASQICVERELGAGIVWECAPLPDGCDQSRDCASCAGVCSESDECLDSDQDNTLTCSCTACA